MINKYTNKQRGLLAVVLAIAMVFAGAAFVAAEVDAYSGSQVENGTTITVDNFSDFNEAMGDSNYTKIVMAADIDVGSTTYNITKNLDLGTYTLSGSHNIAFYAYNSITIENGTLKNVAPAGNLRVIQNVTATPINYIGVTFASDNASMVSNGASSGFYDNCVFDTKGNVGLYINDGAGSVTVDDCTFTGAYGEGAISVEDSTPTIEINSDVPSLNLWLGANEDLDGITGTGSIDKTTVTPLGANNTITGELNIPGDEVVIAGNITVAETGKIVVDGDFVVPAGSTLTNNGEMEVSGEVTVN
ncbi:MAG: hypothetical protein IJV90_05195, partial [Candidatus Methanomethylophilaceae archaeon]|nr:hypothetical protein [Candidatus Methanomethylophilaceae archaeon]